MPKYVLMFHAGTDAPKQPSSEVMDSWMAQWFRENFGEAVVDMGAPFDANCDHRIGPARPSPGAVPDPGQLVTTIIEARTRHDATRHGQRDVPGL